MLPHNGSRISGDPLLKGFDESTRAGASRHEPPFPEREARRIEGGGARDGLGQGSSAAFSGYAASEVLVAASVGSLLGEYQLPVS